VTVRWSVGILTSELNGLGDSDAQGRWIGIRRHQFVFAVVGTGLVGDWVIRPPRSGVELILGVVVLTLAVPVAPGLTAGEAAAVALGFWCRSKWTLVTLDDNGVSLDLRSRGRVDVAGHELVHRGRLDLAGRDREDARSLSSFTDALSNSGFSLHASVHVHSTADAAFTMLALPVDVAPPPGWINNRDCVSQVMGVAPGMSRWLLERWRYVRTSSGVVRVLRVRDFTTAGAGRAALEGLQQTGEHRSVALHFDVLARSRASRLAERAVHRQRSDIASTSSVGFRRTARADRSSERLARREVDIANGRALLRIAAYVVVYAPTTDELTGRLDEVLRAIHESGLRCDSGVGRQARWYGLQLPGGPGW
jgi:hypothetical protein